VFCSVLQCVEISCMRWSAADLLGALQYVAVCCTVLQGFAICCSVLRCIAVCCNGGVSVCGEQQTCEACCSMLQCSAMCSRALQCATMCCDVLQCVAMEVFLCVVRSRLVHVATQMNESIDTCG